MLYPTRHLKLLVILAGLGFGCAADGADPATITDQLTSLTPEELVERLGSRQFQIRQAAERRLLELGTLSFPAVRGAVKSTDAEVTFRANRILRSLQVLATAQNEERLLYAPWTVSGEIEPIWEAWQETVGDSPASRKLFIQALRKEPEMMLSLNSNRITRRTLFENRCGELQVFSGQQSSSVVSPVSVVSMLFIALQEETQPSSKATYVIGNQMNTGPFMSLMDEATVGTAARTLVDRWILHGGLSTPTARLSLSSQVRSPSGLSVAKELLNTGGSTLLQGVYYIVHHGSQQDLELLEAKLDDLSPVVTPVQNQANKGQIQVRDLALNGLLRMTNQSPTEYGIEKPPQDNQPLLEELFKSDLDREMAINKWRVWSRTHLGELQPIPTDASEGTAL